MRNILIFEIVFVVAQNGTLDSTLASMGRPYLFRRMQSWQLQEEQDFLFGPTRFFYWPFS